MSEKLKKIPHFTYSLMCGQSKILCRIKADGQVMHEITGFMELNKFYGVFGYTKEIAMAGNLPDEFIWTEYVSGAAKYSVCYQMHIIEYLNKHSEKFRNLYGEECGVWLTAHAEEKAAEDSLCVACRIKPGC